jgi:hypothetical protein
VVLTPVERLGKNLLTDGLQLLLERGKVELGAGLANGRKL